MRAIQPGDRGPAVQDVQKRLRSLGFDIGPTGVDGVFLGRTADAVKAFQVEKRLSEDAIVGPETWSALVDATFMLGDRMLYLRLPFLHGRDVEVLQSALISLGFACGECDAIFGPFTERAVADFQANAGLVADGIVGDDTVGAIHALRHVWEGKDPIAHSAARVAPARKAAVLERLSFGVCGDDEAGSLVAERIANLARAMVPHACVETHCEAGATSGGVEFIMRLRESGTASALSGCPVVRLAPQTGFAARLHTALVSRSTQRSDVILELDVTADEGEHALQRAAVRVLDALCLIFD
jgi:peptidoglycan hydrolase-like protein with peptidoglycan-binding domain